MRKTKAKKVPAKKAEPCCDSPTYKPSNVARLGDEIAFVKAQIDTLGTEYRDSLDRVVATDAARTETNKIESLIRDTINYNLKQLDLRLTHMRGLIAPLL